MRRYRFLITRPDLPAYALLVELRDDAAAALHAHFLAEWERERLGPCRAREVSVVWRRVLELQTRAPLPYRRDRGPHSESGE